MKIHGIKAREGDTLMRYRGGFFLLLVSLLAASTAVQAAEKLLGLKTAVDSQATTFTLQVPAPVEFTPSQVGPKLYLLDMAGVSTELSSDSQQVESPLVDSYRVFSYQGADSKPHVGLEISLKEKAEVRPRQVPGGLQIQVLRVSAGSAGSRKSPPTAVPAKAPVAVKEVAAVSLREVSVVQPDGSTGLEVEILGDGEMNYKTLRLASPERLVVDLQNTVNRIKQTELAVRTPPLQTVRIAQYRKAPPVSRVVLDLDSKVDFEIRKEAKGLVVALNGSSSSAVGGNSAAGGQAPVKSTAPLELAATKMKKAAEKDAEKAPEKEPLLVASNNGAGVGAATEPTAGPLAWKAEPVISTPAASSAAASSATMQSPEQMLKPVASAQSVAPVQEMAGQEADRSAPGALPPMSLPLSGPQSGLQSGLILLAQNVAQGAPARSGAAPAAAYTGEPISLNLKDVDLKDFFRLMHEVSNLNIVLDPAVAGVVTIVLDEVPWDQAMDVVLRNNQLGKEVTGNVVRIAKLSSIEAEKKQQDALAKASEQAEPVDTVTRTLSYAKAASLLTPLKRFLSARGDLVADVRTNTLIITDTQASIDKVDRLIGNLDKKTQQVEIEARIVAASRSFARDIGSQLAASGLSGNTVLGGAGIVGTSPISRGIVPPLFIGTPPAPPVPDASGNLPPPEFANVSQPLAVNLGAVGATSGFSFLLTGGSSFALDAIITAAESRGLGKLLSRPKIITQNNVEATVEQGVRIPIQTNVNNTISVQFTNAVLRLTVTPQITAEGTVFLKAEIENTTINDGIPRILGIPALNTQAATTEVLVSDGGTVFFGGIIQSTNTLTEQEVPLLGSIPLVGNLFKRKFTRTQTDELLFFITPKIVQS